MNHRLTSLSFHVNQPPIPQIRLLQSLTLKLQGQVHGSGQGHIVNPLSILCTSFSFHINRTNQSWDMSNRVFDLEKTHPNFSKKSWQKRISNRISPKSNQVIRITREIKLPSFVVIGWVVLTLSCRQAIFCWSMLQLWPWVKVTKRSSSTFSQTYTFFVPNI